MKHCCLHPELMAMKIAAVQIRLIQRISLVLPRWKSALARRPRGPLWTEPPPTEFETVCPLTGRGAGDGYGMYRLFLLRNVVNFFRLYRLLRASGQATKKA